MAHKHNGVLFSLDEERRHMSFAGKYMEPEIIILSKISQTQRDK
jgi:hypothetical protein